jgi:hypothetical protein
VGGKVQAYLVASWRHCVSAIHCDVAVTSFSKIHRRIRSCASRASHFRTRPVAP